MSSDKVIAVYATNWATYGRNHQVKDLPFGVATDFIYSFYGISQNSAGHYVPVTVDNYADFDKAFTGDDGVKIKDSWNDPSMMRGNFGQFEKCRKLGKPFKFHLSVGGWSLSKNFSLAMRTPENRTAFIKELFTINDQTKGIIEGISFDWEFLSNNGVNYGASGNVAHPDDEKNFLLFLKEFRQALKDKGLNWIVSFCTTAAPEKIAYNPADLVPYIDEFHCMTYDFTDGNWSEKVASHHTNLYPAPHTKYSVDQAVKAFVERGVPRNKLMIGVAYYSRGFANTDGLGKPASGGSPDKTWEDGVCDYKTLPQPGATEYYDEQCCAAYSYDPVRRVFNSYDNVQSVKAKAEYVVREGLKGILVWEASGDFPVGHAKNLTKVMRDVFNGSVSSVTPVTPVTPVAPVTPATTTTPPGPAPNTSRPPLAPRKPAPLRPPGAAPRPTSPGVCPPPPPSSPSSTPSSSPTPVAGGVQFDGNFKQYKAGDEVVHNGVSYVCLQSHTSQSDWSPDKVPALWKLK